LVYPLTARFPSSAPHSEAQAESNVAANSEVAIEWKPANDNEAFVPLIATFYNTAPGVFDVTGEHAFMKKHTISLTEDVLADGWRPNRILVVTRRYPLKFTFRNKTVNTEFVGITIHHLVGARDRMLELARKLEEEFSEFIRRV